MLMRVSYDPKDGKILGFFSSDIDYGEDEPKNYVTIDEWLFNQIKNVASMYKVDLVTLKVTAIEDPKVAYSMRLSKKLNELNHACDLFISQLRGKYSSMEVESWPKQEQGAKDILSGNMGSNDAIFVINMASKRNVDVIELANRILANVEEANPIVSGALGHMQKLQDMACALDPEDPETPSKLKAIVWNTDFMNEQ